MGKKYELVFAMNNLLKRLRRAIDDVEAMKVIVKRREPTSKDRIQVRMDDPEFGKGGLGRSRYELTQPEDGLVRQVEELIRGRYRITTAELMAEVRWPEKYEQSEHRRKIDLYRAMKKNGWIKRRSSMVEETGKRPEYFAPLTAAWPESSDGPAFQRFSEAAVIAAEEVREVTAERVVAPRPKVPAVTEPVAEPLRPVLYAVPVYPHRMWWDNEDTPEALVARAEAAKGPMVPTPDGWVRAAAPAAPAGPAAGPVAPPAAAPGSSGSSAAPGADQATEETPTTSVVLPAPVAPKEPDLWAEMSEKIDPNLL